MAKKNNNIKEYGVDLEKQFEDAQRKVKNVTNKILKRAKFLCEVSPKTKINDITVAGYYHKYPDAKDGLKFMQVCSLLHIIKTIEKEYVEQTEQLDMFEKRTIGAIEFNKLSDNEKWDALRAESQGKVEFIGIWLCWSCGEEDEIGPHRASPFSGAEVCCGNCDAMLTRRTGGGQSDPFNWQLVEIIS